MLGNLKKGKKKEECQWVVEGGERRQSFFSEETQEGFLDEVAFNLNLA